MLGSFPPSAETNSVSKEFLDKERTGALGNYVAYVPVEAGSNVPNQDHVYILESYGSELNLAGVNFLHDTVNGSSYSRFWDASSRGWSDWKPIGGAGSAVSDFSSLTDTPSGYADHAGKLLCVNATEDGLDYVVDSAIPIMEALENGNLPIKWNNMKQKIAASSNNIAATYIAENAFTIGQGGTAGRTFTLPDIVEADTSPLPANTVREGRITVLTLQGSAERSVLLTGGCKFAIGGTTTTSFKLYQGQTAMFIPAIYGNGDKCWCLFGVFSANQDALHFQGGLTRVNTRCITGSLARGAANVAQINSANVDVIIGTGTGNAVYSLPEIKATGGSAHITSTQVRQGRELIIYGTSPTGTMTIQPHTGQKLCIDGINNIDERIMKAGAIEKYRAEVINGTGVWIRMQYNRLDGMPVGWSELSTKVTELEARPSFTPEYKTKVDELYARPEFTDGDQTLINGMTNGNTPIHPKCISTPTSMISNAADITNTKAQLAQGRCVVLNGTAKTTCMLPDVISAGELNVESSEVRVGSEITLVNIGTVEGEMISPSGVPIIGLGTTGPIYRWQLPVGMTTKFLAMSTGGGGFAWLLMSHTDVPEVK